MLTFIISGLLVHCTLIYISILCFSEIKRGDTHVKRGPKKKDSTKANVIAIILCFFFSIYFYFKVINIHNLNFYSLGEAKY